MPHNVNERLDELEIRASYQDRLLEELNAVVTDCNLRIDQLTRQNRQLQDMVKNLGGSLEESPDE
ncbi:SlyX family protein [Pelovirga terrestris]|uniref:SlyX family protein n=1 Tax=Pelovirga terrestris TaxID=2771352 RepID=A0A8J6QPP2_9BACT|nr:SlyX family protein [Pelovirga terrestris]MBD1400496.1 SlyX family protein [Pelovirga terrestris]